MSSLEAVWNESSVWYETSDLQIEFVIFRILFSTFELSFSPERERDLPEEAN